MDFFRDEDIKHYGKILLIGISVFLIGVFALYFVFRPNHHIVLKTNTIEYGEKIDGPATLVDKVGNVRVSSSHIRSSTTIKLDQYEVSFDKIDTKILGDQEIIAKFSDLEIKPQTLIVKIVDTTAPEIVLNDVPENVDLAYIQSEEYRKQITVRDNCTSAEYIDMDYSFSEEPDYGVETELKIIANDENGNTSETTHLFRIKEDPAKVEQKESEKNEEMDSISNESQNNGMVYPEASQPVIIPPAATPEIQTPVQPQPPVVDSQPQPQRPSNKTYMFSDGYNMQTAPSACQSDLMSSGFSGACIPIQGDDGIYKGMQLIFD